MPRLIAGLLLGIAVWMFGFLALGLSMAQVWPEYGIHGRVWMSEVDYIEDRSPSPSGEYPRITADSLSGIRPFRSELGALSVVVQHRSGVACSTCRRNRRSDSRSVCETASQYGRSSSRLTDWRILERFCRTFSCATVVNCLWIAVTRTPSDEPHRSLRDFR